MKRIALLAAAAALGLPAAAVAKGPAEATITGPGLDRPIVLRHGEPGAGTPLGTIVDSAGFFAALFGQSPNPVVAKRPEGELGPKYTITYRMPNPIRQDIYPYAEPAPVVHTAPAQPFWDTRTRGGWYVAGVQLRHALIAAGLPATAPRATGARTAWILAPIAALLLASVSLARRRHP